MKKFSVFLTESLLRPAYGPCRRLARVSLLESKGRGFTYLESVVALAIIGICALTLFSSFRSAEASRKRAEQHARAISALISQADLIRSGMAPRDPGRHSFAMEDKLLKDLRGARGYYMVSRLPKTPGLLSVKIHLTWHDRIARRRSLEIYVRE